MMKMKKLIGLLDCPGKSLMNPQTSYSEICCAEGCHNCFVMWSHMLRRSYADPNFALTGLR
jgi:hypothetical protein